MKSFFQWMSSRSGSPTARKSILEFAGPQGQPDPSGMSPMPPMPAMQPSAGMSPMEMSPMADPMGPSGMNPNMGGNPPANPDDLLQQLMDVLMTQPPNVVQKIAEQFVSGVEQILAVSGGQSNF
jgi:hypothetical protein